MPDSEPPNVISVPGAPSPAATPTPGVVPTAGATAATAPAKPVRGLTWVAPAVSFAVIAGFFAMVGTLLHENYYPPIAVPAVTAPTPTGTPAAVNSPSAPSTPVTPNAPAAANTPGAPSTPTARKVPAPTNPPSTPNAPVTPASLPVGTTNPNNLQNVLFTLLGALGAAFTQVMNFWLGSSKGSSDKTDLLAATNPAIGAK